MLKVAKQIKREIKDLIRVKCVRDESKFKCYIHLLNYEIQYEIEHYPKIEVLILEERESEFFYRAVG